jgi:hypothetical protein
MATMHAVASSESQIWPAGAVPCISPRSAVLGEAAFDRGRPAFDAVTDTGAVQPFQELAGAVGSKDRRPASNRSANISHGNKVQHFRCQIP